MTLKSITKHGKNPVLIEKLYTKMNIKPDPEVQDVWLAYEEIKPEVKKYSQKNFMQGKEAMTILGFSSYQLANASELGLIQRKKFQNGARPRYEYYTPHVLLLRDLFEIKDELINRGVIEEVELTQTEVKQIKKIKYYKIVPVTQARGQDKTHHAISILTAYLGASRTKRLIQELS